MKRTKLGGLDAIVCGGTDREGGGDGPVVVLLHGFGAPGDDLVSLYRVLDVPRDTRFVFPAALLSLASEGFGPGRAWWRIDMAALQRGDLRLTTDVPAGLADARAAVVSLLTHLETEWNAPPSRVVLGGFSQGAMLSLDVALRHASPFAGVALLSGSLIAEGEWRPLLATNAPRAVFQSHGSMDPILPFPVAEALGGLLRDAGSAVTWVPFRGGHEIPPPVLDGLGRFIGERFAASGTQTSPSP